MIRQCEENKSGCLTAVRTAAVRTRDNKETSALGEWNGVRHPRLGRSTFGTVYVSRRIAW